MRPKRCLGVVLACSLFLSPVCVFCESPDAHSSAEPAVSATEALTRLKVGNARFVGGQASHPDQNSKRMASLVSGQHPFAIILSCSDSRVPPEIVFDQGLGDLFVIREAGNTLNDVALGSIEYAVEHLGAPLIVVMGHEKCGAVTAAMSGHAEAGHIPALTHPISPVIAQAKKMSGDPVHNAVLLNAERVAKELSQSGPFLKQRVGAGTLQIVVAVYDVTSGRVTFEQ